MAVVLALTTAALYGTSDFFGGNATRHRKVAEVMLWVHGIGLIGVTAVAPLLADRLIVADLGWGVLAGLVGLMGLLMLYWALANGPMGVVAPLAGLMTAVVPVVWGLRPPADPISSVVATGMGLGLVAVVATSWPTGKRDAALPITPLLIAVAIAAGSCFGALLLIYDATQADGAPWPIVASRLATTSLLLAYALTRRAQYRANTALSPTPALGSMAIAGVGDVFANVTLLAASTTAIGATELSIVAVVAAFYPAATVVWARVLLGERLGWVRTAGLVCAFGAIALMTLG